MLPAGPKNLESLFPAVDFSQVDEYYLELVNQDDLSTILTTNNYNRACCCNEDTIRLLYVNYLGGIDGINLKELTEDHDTVSTSWKKPLVTPHAKWDGGRQRFNVNSNETVTGENTCFQEADQDYLKELLDTSNAWIQWTGTQGQDDDYIPVVILDGKWQTRKEKERYYYTMQIQFVYANENIILRN